MKFVIDCEFDGFNGPLISMALVPMDQRLDKDPIHTFYQVTDHVAQDEWVKKNVMCHINDDEGIPMDEFQDKLSEFLFLHSHNGMEEIVILADWPDDIAYFMKALISAPGKRIFCPDGMKFELHFVDGESAVPHHALHDAIGIREILMCQITGSKPSWV